MRSSPGTILVSIARYVAEFKAVLGPKHSSGNCYVRCFVTDKTALAEFTQIIHTAILEYFNIKE